MTMIRGFETSWLQPTVMVASFVTGIGFAIGHHFFYDSLAGSPASTSNFDVLGFSMSPQQISISAGTTFALLVRIFLWNTVSVTYTQCFWKAASQNREQMDGLDAMFSALGDLTAFFNAETWWRHPILLLVAIIGW
jgi:hypothetical protein